MCDPGRGTAVSLRMSWMSEHVSAAVPLHGHTAYPGSHHQSTQKSRDERYHHSAKPNHSPGIFQVKKLRIKIFMSTSFFKLLLTKRCLK